MEANITLARARQTSPASEQIPRFAPPIGRSVRRASARLLDMETPFGLHSYCNFHEKAVIYRLTVTHSGSIIDIVLGLSGRQTPRQANHAYRESGLAKGKPRGE